MKITYVYHSCCAIEFQDFSVIIDFHKDAFDENQENDKGWVAKNILTKVTPLYVLCTHSHSDHFNKEILTWRKDRGEIIYVFSKEIQDKIEASLMMKDKKIIYLDKLEVFEDENLCIKAFGSTDLGGSFYIEHNDTKLFHAGDLNNWHWNEEVSQDESLVFENQYICELELVSEAVKEVDVVMFPLDPRLGEDFMRGGEQFINKVKTHNFMPLHFGDNYELLKQFAPIALAANCKLLELEHTGQSFKIK